ncbi:MAG: hypothetical protein ACREF4_09180 [Gammaproteobacteria bacterium]
MTTIGQERAKLAQVGLRLRQHHEWGALTNYTTARTVVEPAGHQFVHVSVTNRDNFASNDAHVRMVEAIGRARFGTSVGCSYNRGFTLDGTPYEMQPIGRRGAHTVNDFHRSTCTTSGCPSRGRSLLHRSGWPVWNLNYNARAYVVCGNVDDPISDELVDQIARALAADRLAGFVRADSTLHGHRCCSAKSCPGDRVWAAMARIQAQMKHYLQEGLMSATVEQIEALLTKKRGQFPSGNPISIAATGAHYYAWLARNLGLEIKAMLALQADDEEKLTAVIKQMRADLASDIINTLMPAIQEIGENLGLPADQIDALAAAVAAKVERVTVVVESPTP